MNASGRWRLLAPVFCVSFCALGCAAELESFPGERGQGGPSTGAGGTGGPLTTCESAVARLSSTNPSSNAMGCAATTLCHGAMTIPGVPSFVPDAAAAMRGVSATYAAVTNALDCPQPPEVLLVPGDPDSSLLVRKLKNDQSCGLVMPMTGFAYTREEISCVEDWIRGMP